VPFPRRPSRAAPACASALAGIALVALIAGCAAPRVAHDAPLPATLEREALAAALAEKVALSEQLLADLVPATQPGCSAAVGDTGEVVWAGAAGLADLDTGTPLTTQTRFDIASVSKQFTATAILMLQHEGLLSLDDPIATYVDDLPEWGESVTLEQLMHQTSRIPDFWVQLDDEDIGFADAADQATTLEAIARETELDSDGDGFLYSNSNYVLLAEVVARVSGLALPDFLAQRVFGPLALDMAVAPTLDGPDIARPYGDTLELEEGGWSAYGHVGIITTPSELVRWGDQYRDGEIVQDDFAVGAVDDGEGERYAAGINIRANGDLGHTGRWGGYVSEFTVSGDRRLTIAVLCNGHASDRFGVTDGLWAIWDPEHPRDSPPR
jgi:CubicO group peptidase (beta-lactamase class C family)